MRHNQYGTGFIGDIAEPVQMRQAGQYQIAATRVKFITTNKDGKVHVSTIGLEAFGQEATGALQKLPVGSTIMFRASIRNQKFVDQNGQERWNTVLQASEIAYCGKSTEAAKEQQQQAQPAPGGYQQPQQGGYQPPQHGGYPQQNTGYPQQAAHQAAQPQQSAQTGYTPPGMNPELDSIPF